MSNNYKPTCITITFLTKVTYSSLNGGDSDTDNINVIKKITAKNGEEFPYVSSQALRRALRDQLSTLGYPMSPVTCSDSKPDGDDDSKHPPITSCDPVKYIDDDLFGYMNAQAGDTAKRTSPVRVSPLVALSEYKADLDFGTNYMGKDDGMDPNIYETEMHSGIYRGSILIELDRIGTCDGFVLKAPTKKSKKKTDSQPPIADLDNSLTNSLKVERVLAFLDAFQNLWSSGRQTRFLADISPKFIAAAYLKSKNPIFLETMGDGVNVKDLKNVIEDYESFVEDYTFAAQSSTFALEEGVVSLKDGFAKIRNWVKSYYEVK